MSSPFPHRGVIEGYYGPPFSDAARRWLIEAVGRHGMNVFCYAPKNDPLQRAEWRTPYSHDAMTAFSSLVDFGERHGVRVGFCVSPGLSMRYSDATDVRLLTEKFRAFSAIGSRFLMLAFDDVPSRLLHDEDRRRFASLVEAQIEVARAVRDALGPDRTLVFGPVDYLGVEPTDALAQLGEGLPREVEIFWTGRTVCSPEILEREAAARAATLRRRVLVWDNVPVSDGPMRPMLHLGPFARREAGLTEHCSGFLLNTMEHAHASAIAVLGAARWMQDPAGYEPERCWHELCEELGAGAPQAFTLFAAAHRFSAIHPGDRDRELEAAFRAWTSALCDDPSSARDPGAIRTATATLRAQLDERAGCAQALRDGLADRDLAREIEPWITTHHAQTERMRAAVQLVETIQNDEIARLHRVAAFFGLSAKLAPAAEIGAVSYGPGRALYPQLVSMRDDEAGFGADPVLFLDHCLADEVCRFAERFALAALGGGVH